MSFTKLHFFFDDVEVGQEWDSVGRTVTRVDITNYAAISGDFNPVHTDYGFAKALGHPGPVAHDQLIWAFISGLGLMAPPMRTLAFVSIPQWEFKCPILAGDTIKLRTRVMQKEERSRGRRGVITWHLQVFNQDGKIVQEGLTVTLVEGRASAAARREAMM